MSASPADIVGSSISDGADNAQEVIKDNMPLVFAVAVAMVAWSVGRRVLGKI